MRKKKIHPRKGKGVRENSEEVQENNNSTKAALKMEDQIEKNRGLSKEKKPPHWEKSAPIYFDGYQNPNQKGASGTFGRDFGTNR